MASKTVGQMIPVLLEHARGCIRLDTNFDDYDDYWRGSSRKVAQLIVDLGFIDGEYVDLMGEPWLNAVGTIDKFIQAYDYPVNETQEWMCGTDCPCREVFAQ